MKISGSYAAALAIVLQNIDTRNLSALQDLDHEKGIDDDLFGMRN